MTEQVMNGVSVGVLALFVSVTAMAVIMDALDRRERQGQWQCANYPTDHQCVELHGKPRP